MQLVFHRYLLQNVRYVNIYLLKFLGLFFPKKPNNISQ